MADSSKQEKWQEIANRGLQDRFSPEDRVKFDEAVRRGLITLPAQQTEGAQAGATQSRGLADTAIAGAGEFAAGANRQIMGLIDFLGPDTVNAILQVAGSEKRVPTLTESFAEPRGAFLGEGIGADIMGGAGEVAALSAGGGAALRGGASMLNPLARQSEGVASGTLRQMGQTTPTQDVAYGTLAGIGEAYGQDKGGDTGAMVGALMFPVVAGASANALKGILSKGGQGVANLTKELSKMSDDGAATLLSEQMVREGLSPDDVIKILDDLGPEAIPADVANSFARLLRVAGNKIPRIEGQAAQVLKDRQLTQGQRIAAGIDDVAGGRGLTLDDEIARMDSALTPRISQLYDEVGESGIQLSPRLQSMMSGKNSLGRARVKAEKRLADARAAGDTITNIDIINATKQELDDQINTALRQGKNNRVRDLVRLKNMMVDEADIAIPVYREARDLFAGKAAMESAADAGTQFFRLKPREVDAFIKSMSESERRMFRLGAKQAVVDRIEDTATNADLVKRLFGKNGDVAKLRALFPDEESFKAFSDTLEREAQFVLTRRAAQANSTTAKQIADSNAAGDALNSARAMLGDTTAQAEGVMRIFSGLKSKKGEKAFTEALEKAGDILLETGMNPRELQRILRQGDSARIGRLLEQHLIKPSQSVAPSTTAGAAAVSDEL